MDKEDLYYALSERKQEDRHLLPYNGGNGRIDRFLDLVRNNHAPRGGDVLDVGGSHGDLLELATREKLFDNGCVLDISEIAVKTAKARGLVAYKDDIDKNGFEQIRGDKNYKGFNAIVALDVIEHLIDPIGFAKECFKALNHNGYVFINTPNISYWRHLQELVIGGRFPHTSGDKDVYHGGHLAFYNENDLIDIFSSVGFLKHQMKVFSVDSGEQVPHIWMNLLSGEKDQSKKVRMLSQPDLLFMCKKAI